MNQDTKEVLIFGITMGTILGLAISHALPTEVLGAVLLAHIGTHGAGMLAGRAMTGAQHGPRFMDPGGPGGLGGPGAAGGLGAAPASARPIGTPLTRAAVAGLAGLLIYGLTIWLSPHRAA